MNDRAPGPAARPWRAGCRSCRAPTWRVYEVRSNSWSRRRRRSRPARPSCGRPRAGCRRGCGRAATPSCASAQWSVAPSPMTRGPMLERDRSWPAAPGGWRTRAWRRRRGGPRACPARSDCAGRRPPIASDGTSSSTIDASAPSPSSMSVRVEQRRGPAAPAAQRMTIGRSSRTPAGTSTTHALASRARGSAGASLSSAGSAAPPSSRSRDAVRVAREQLGERLERRRRPPCASAASDRPRSRRPRRARCRPPTPSGSSAAATAVGRRPAVRRTRARSSALRRST